jgi:hypothetical protein
MAAGLWHELLVLKRHRERRAQLQLQARRSEWAAAQQAQLSAGQVLQAHRRLADEHEGALYADLLRRRVRLRDIEQVQQAVAQLRRTEQGLQQRLEEATALTQRRAESSAQAQQQHRAAERVMEKFDQLARQHLDAAARQAEHDEELELDEAAAQRRDRNDWDRSDENPP